MNRFKRILLFSELKTNELYEYTNVIITSDHGMASLNEDNLILLDPDDENDIRRKMLKSCSS